MSRKSSLSASRIDGFTPRRAAIGGPEDRAAAPLAQSHAVALALTPAQPRGPLVCSVSGTAAAAIRPASAAAAVNVFHEHFATDSPEQGLLLKTTRYDDQA